MDRKATRSRGDSSKLRIPMLTHRRSDGRAVVRLNGRDRYCGDWGTVAAKAEYDRLIGLWLAMYGRLRGGLVGANKRHNSPTNDFT